MEKGIGFEKEKKTVSDDGFVGGFFPVSTTKIAWKSRKRSGFFHSFLFSQTIKDSSLLLATFSISGLKDLGFV